MKTATSYIKLASNSFVTQQTLTGINYNGHILHLIFSVPKRWSRSCDSYFL